MLAQREFVGRYRGNFFGISTALVVPVLFLLVYGFVFSQLIPIEVRPGVRQSGYGFFLFAGFIGWNLFADTASRAPRLYPQSASLVRSSLLPLSALPVASALASLATGLLWLSVFVGLRAWQGEALGESLWMAPLALLGVAVVAVGFALALAALGVVARELGELIAPAVGLGFFLSPVIYPAQKLAEHSQWLLVANPVAGLIETLRASLLADAAPSPELLQCAVFWPCIALAVGLVVHRSFARRLVDRI
jgi:lipopolysaccharide transport system permease protein